MEEVLDDESLVRSKQSSRCLSVIFAIIGIGYLFPFSALTQPVDYWHVLFPTLDMEFYITSVYLYTNVVALGLVVSFGSIKNLSYAQRIVGGFLGQLTVLVFVPLASYIIYNESALAAAILSATAVAAISTAFLDSCVIALASTFPVQVQEALQFGVGLSTLIGSLYRDLTKLVFPQDQVKTSSAVYFLVGVFTIATCIAAYSQVRRFQRNENTPEINYQVMSESTDVPSSHRWKVLRKCLPIYCITVVMFITTLSVWPPLVTEIKSFNSPALQSSGWWPLILLTIVSVTDCIGRLFVPYRLGLTKETLWKPVAVRVLLVPCIVMCVRGIWFTHDAWSVLFVSLLGLSNGFLGSLCIIFATEMVDDPADRPTAGSFAGFFLISGLVIGSSVGLAFTKMIRD
ncbi:unnamed protein product [Aphanomyces euteiches]|uniref:Major facilitator superfamily (MFS) profile domain-containing protein n=1 Tax=Aphanomyces euteiches TaxID=100861 RepID=A0A6G0XHE3_9STRA|nr:hypothetical protein Ae201684_004861 [Aphanomyces euteiches]KAH9082421.1 hypothetical protein Ae201684P_009746 [Aphanomyces euteiches]KAH9157066.1 hypothetical protein AeRB84_001104 [Aphanomyces euteiches]